MTGNRKVLQAAATATGNGSTFGVMAFATVVFQVSGTFVGTITFEGTVDGVNWVAIQAASMSDGSVATTATAAGLYAASIAGLGDLRARISGYTSGSITVTARAVSEGSAMIGADIDISGSEEVDVISVPDALQGPGNPSVDSFSTAVVNLAASTANQEIVAAPGANKQIWVYALALLADTAAGTIVFQDEDDTALTGTFAVSDEGGFVLPPSGNFAMPWIKVATGKALEADTGACTVDGVIAYAIVSV